MSLDLSNVSITISELESLPPNARIKDVVARLKTTHATKMLQEENVVFQRADDHARAELDRIRRDRILMRD